MKFCHRAGICLLALVAGTAALQVEPAVIRNLSLETASGHVSVGAVKVPFWSTAWAQSADSFSLENVSFTFGQLSYEMKRIDLSGATTPRAEIEALFASGSTEPVATRLARINAKQITIPEAKFKATLPGHTQSTTYKNIVLSDIVAGRIGDASFETASIETTDNGITLLASAGKGSAHDLDLGALANLYETKAKTASEPMTRIYGDFAIENIDISDSENLIGVKVAHVSGRDFLARPTPESWSGMEAVLSELDGKDDLSPEETKRLFTLIADMLDAFQIGQVEATGIEIKNPPKDGSKATAPIGRIERMAYTSGSGQQPSDMRMEGFEVVDDESKVKIGSLSLTGFSIAPTLDGLRALGGKSLEDLDMADARSLMPTLGTLRVTDLDVDAPAEDEKPTERVRMTMGLLEVTADKPRNGIPTNIRIEQRNTALSFDENSTEELAQQLRALGYTSLEASTVVAASWDEASSEIVIKEFSADAKDMGSVRMTGLIGNVSADLFSLDEGTAAAALLGSKAKSANIVIEDRGLLDRYLAMTAKDNGTTPAALKEMYAGAAPLVLSSMIGDSEQSRTLSKAIANFIKKPGKLTIEAKPKSASGFGIMDAMLISDPKALLTKLNVSAKAE